MTSCEHWDCGFCYAPYYLKTSAINGACNNPYKCPTFRESEPVQYETPMTKSEEEIEKVKAQIKVLEKKLSFLEELEKTKSPVEEAYRDWCGQYPKLETDSKYDVIRWQGFQAGYNAAYEEKVSETAQERGERVHKEMEETIKIHDGYGVVDYKPTPQTPEQVADGLKKAFREAVKQGVVSSSTKPQTLYDVIADWWDDTFTKRETSLHDLVDRIEEWLPKEQSAAGSQNAYVECTVEGFNDCLDKIKNKLR